MHSTTHCQVLHGSVNPCLWEVHSAKDETDSSTLEIADPCMAMVQTEEGVGDITSISLGSKRTSDSIVPAQAEHQRVASSSSVSNPSTNAVSHLLSPARDSINGNITPQATKQDDTSNRVQVLCRFRCPAKIDGYKACMTARGTFDGAGNGRSWLQFGDSRDEEHNYVSGVAGGTRRALETVSIRTGYEWSRRAFDRVFKPDTSQAEVRRAVIQRSV